MNNSGVSIKYGDIAIGAKESFEAFTEDKEEFVDLSQLQKYNINMENYGNPCELYSVSLDGEAKAFPSNPEKFDLGLWSKQISLKNGKFENPIWLILESDTQFTSSGIAFTFDTYNQIFPKHINITWHRINNNILEDLGEGDFYPDNAFYNCKKKVENYNFVIITFDELNMPFNRLKLKSIDYGFGTFFDGNNLRSVNLIQEINPLSTEISINTVDFVFEAQNASEYSFQLRQPLSIYFNGELKATTFVKSAKRQSKYLWRVKSEDYIGLMGETDFYGGIYYEKNAVELLKEIFATAKVPYIIDESFLIETVTGYIPYSTCREALMQVAFSIGAIVDTSNSAAVNIYKENNIETQYISANRITQGQAFQDSAVATTVEVVSHSYAPIEETTKAYIAEENKTEENVFVIFSEPLHDLIITNGLIVSYGTNYAIINAYEGCVLEGKKYKHDTIIKQKKYPSATQSIPDSIISIKDATLVSPNNVDKVLQRCYNFYENNTQINLGIVEGKHEANFKKYGESVYGTFNYGNSEKNNVKYIYDQPTKVGETIVCATEYLGDLKGIITSQRFNLNGGIIIKDTQLKQIN